MSYFNNGDRGLYVTVPAISYLHFIKERVFLIFKSRIMGKSMSDSMDEYVHFLTILREDEFRELKKVFPHDNELLRSIRSIRYCKAEVFLDCILGNLASTGKMKYITLTCCLWILPWQIKNFFNWGTVEIETLDKKKEEEFQELKSLDQFLLKMMELMIENDLLYLLHLERNWKRWGRSAHKSVPDNFFTVLTKYRQKLSESWMHIWTAGYDWWSIASLKMGLTAIIHNTESIGIVMHSGQNVLHNSHVHLLRENIYIYVNCINPQAGCTTE